MIRALAGRPAVETPPEMQPKAPCAIHCQLGPLEELPFGGRQSIADTSSGLACQSIYKAAHPNLSRPAQLRPGGIRSNRVSLVLPPARAAAFPRNPDSTGRINRRARMGLKVRRGGYRDFGAPISVFGAAEKNVVVAIAITIPNNRGLSSSVRGHRRLPVVSWRFGNGDGRLPLPILVRPQIDVEVVAVSLPGHMEITGGIAD